MPYYSNYLAHYGVKGMKWGVRRYRNEDGSLTALGEKRRNLRIAKRGKDEAQKNYAQREFDDQKTYEKSQAQKKKSKRQVELEEQYKSEGFNDRDAEIQAYRRAKTERALKVAAGLTVAAVGAYVAYKHYDNVTDRVLNEGFELGRISGNNNKGVKDAFYAFTNSKDARKYTGLYGRVSRHRARTSSRRR